MLLQALQQSEPLKDFVQYIADAAAIGAFGFAWRTNTRVTRLETILSEPEAGIIPRLTGTVRQGHTHATTLQGHDIILGHHDREIERLDRDKEPRRHLGPSDVGTMRPK